MVFFQTLGSPLECKINSVDLNKTLPNRTVLTTAQEMWNQGRSGIVHKLKMKMKLYF